MMAARAHCCPVEREVARLRRHREELQFALDHNLSLDQARERLKTYHAHRPRLEGPPAPAATAPAERPPHWWQRDDL